MIDSVELRMVALPLVRPFRTSFGVETEKECILVRVRTSGAEGWGECVAGSKPDYSSEFNEAAWVTLRDHLIPPLLAMPEVAVQDLGTRLGHVRGHRMSKAALEMAVLDADLHERGVSLRTYLGGERERVEVGVSIGIAPTIDELVEQAGGYLAEGYRRVKLKIEPGFDVEPVAAVRAAFPDALLSVDANAAYGPADAGVFHALDAFGLLMIEQPFSHEDLLEHSKLQLQLETAICLDESIRSEADARAAIEIGACRIINIKPGRVGGLSEGVRIHDLAKGAGIPVWCGGMLETGVGRAGNLALASLPGFTLPGDISGSTRYFDRDLTTPFAVDADGTMGVPSSPGIGVTPLPDRLEEFTRRVGSFSRGRGKSDKSTQPRGRSS